MSGTMPESLPETMKAIEIKKPGGPEELVLASRPVPKPSPGQVLIRVRAAGVNRPDVIQRQGHYAPQPGASDIPGLEVAGEVVLGDGLPLGSQVAALVTGGGYAEYCVGEVSSCLPIPRGFSQDEAAGLPETFFTVWHNVFQRGRLKEGETFLVHGGSSGIGTTAIQLAKAFGAKVIATAGSAEKCEACVKLGADLAINYRDEDFVAAVAAFTGKKGVDVILDMVGGDYLPRNIKCLAFDGRHVSIAFLNGSSSEINFMPLMLKRLTLTGSTLRPQSVAAKASIALELKEKVWPLMDRGAIRPLIAATFPLEEAASAHRLMESSQHIGKIILQLQSV
jgi:NADPH2:quinone reductase